MIEFACPQCHEPMMAPDGLAGVITPCKPCGVNIIIPFKRNQPAKCPKCDFGLVLGKYEGKEALFCQQCHRFYVNEGGE